MAASRQRTKNRRESGSFVAIPKQVLESDAYTKLNSHEVKLLIDLAAQYNGKNNGDLCAAWRLMRMKGWRSKGTLSRALSGLMKYGFVILTRQGGRHKAALYAITFRAINECGGKLDVNPTVTAINSWRENRIAAPNKGQCTPKVGQL